MRVSHEIYNATVLEPLAATLGESPVWHSQRQACFWVDIESCRIYEYDWKNKRLKKHDLRQRVSLVVPSADGQLIREVLHASIQIPVSLHGSQIWG